MIELIPKAQAAINESVLGNVLNPIIVNVVRPLVELAFAVAVVVFVFGIIQMIANATDENARTKGRWNMLGGLVGMLIMLSAWGIINLVSNTIKAI